MIKVAWVIGKLVAGIFLSIFYIKLLFHHHVFTFSLFGTDNRNLNYFFPALLSGPFLAFLLSSRKWSVAAFIVLLLMVMLPSIDVQQQVAMKAEEEREYQEHMRRQMAAEQSALPVIAKTYPRKITNQEFDGGPWGDCTSILARVEGSRETILYETDEDYNEISTPYTFLDTP
ncbi:hypothetical protein ACFLFF_20120 [Brevibacillus reuszeri]|uniref:hypothetical protein n=1 Tax=Brevibacillus reuszeri TaxID=54915 RepID=UPI003671E6D8